MLQKTRSTQTIIVAPPYARCILELHGKSMRKNSLHHHLVALWFADIAGYSTRVVEDERGALQLVEILQALSRSTVQRHEGRVVKFLGDAVLAEFPSTEMAVRAAAVLSKEYAEHSAKTGRSHDLRIGVHLGDVALDADGDLYGDGVNAAARIEAAVNPGQVVVSEDVWRQIRGREGFRFEPFGNRNLKGVGSIDLYVSLWTKASRRRKKGVSVASKGKKGFGRSLFCPLLISVRNATRNTLVMVLPRKSSTLSVRLPVSTFRPEHHVLHFVEPPWTRARLASVLASRRFSMVASEKLESVFGSACNSLTQIMGISFGLNASIARLKTSSQSRMRSPEAFWSC